MAKGQEVGKKIASKSRTALLRRVKQESLRKVSFLKHKAVIDYKDVYRLIRNFFKEFLEKHYEFTVSELRRELEKTYLPVAARQDLLALLREIEKMEYATAAYDRQALVMILDRFEKVVEELVRSSGYKRSIIAKIKGFIIKQEEDLIIISELPVIERDDEMHVHLNLILERLYLFMNGGKLKKAKNQYQELIKLYDQTPEDIKKEFYVIVDEAYNALLELAMKK